MSKFKNIKDIKGSADDMAAEIYARMVSSGKTNQYDLKHLAVLARDAAAAFYADEELPSSTQIEKAV